MPTHRAILTASRFDRRLRQLLDEVAASRVTVRLDWPAMGFHVNDVAGEALQIGERSLRGQTSIDQRAAGTVRWLERERRTLVQHDLAGAEPPAPQALIELYGTRAQMLAPLVHQGALMGWVSVHENRAPRRWAEAEVAAIERAAAWFVAEIEAGHAAGPASAEESIPSIQDYLAPRSAAASVLAPDGRLLAWIDNRTGAGQIWGRELPDGQPRRLLATTQAVGLLAFSPAGRDLVFGMDQGGDERQQLWLLPAGEEAARPLTRNPSAIHAWGAWDAQGRRIAFAGNGRDPRHMDVYVQDIGGSTPRRVLEGEGWREPLAFSPDGASLLVQDCRRGMFDTDLLRLDLASGACETLLPSSGAGSRHLQPRWRKDGCGFFLLTEHGRDYLGIAFLDLATRNLAWIATPEGDVVAMALSADEKRLAYVVNQEGWHRIVLRDLASGQERTLDGHPPGTLGGLAFTPDGASLVFPLAGFTRPSAIWRADLETGSFACIGGGDRLSLREEDLTEAHLDRVRSFDGREVPVFLFEPRGPAPAGGRPALIVVHGGPEMQYDAHWQPEVQYFARRGWLVVAPNVRGSTGYGRTWQALDDRQLRMDAVKDLQAVRAWTAARPDVDASRLALFGGSYGGFMTLAALTAEPDAWKVAAEFYGVVNFRTMIESTGPWRQALRAAEYGDPAADREMLERFSPIHRAQRIEVPLFIAHGLEDPRVAPSESEMLVSILRGLGKPHEFLRIPGEGHGFAGAANRELIYTALVRFLERHIGPA